MTTEEDRTALRGLETRLFQLVSEKATTAQWAEWLRAPLEHAVAEADKDLALALLKAGANGGAGWKGCGDRTLLQAAAEGGDAEVVHRLLHIAGTEELDTVSGDKSRRTALHRAATGGHTDAARMLVLAGANVGLVDGKGSTALHYAIEGGHLQLAGDLVIAGADLEAKDSDGNTPLHLAAGHDDEKFITALIRRGVCVSGLNQKGEHPLHIAVGHQQLAVTKALLTAGADPNGRFGDANRFSPLFLARRNVAMTKTLLGSSADVESVDQLGYTALHWAAIDGIPEVVDALVEVGADVESRSLDVLCSAEQHRCKGLAPLHLAAYWEKLGPMLALLHNGADVNAQDDDGHRPLHKVCKYPKACSVAVADLLLRWGADETATDDDGNTSADLLKSGAEPNERLQRLLASAPADRAWRRRGMVVMLRAQGVEAGSAAPADRACRRRGTLAMCTQGENAATTTTIHSVLARLVGLEDEALFQAIVRYL